MNSKMKINDFTKILNKILKIKVPIFPIDGETLKQKGMQEGQSLGSVLKTLEKEWINNNFKICEDFNYKENDIYIDTLNIDEVEDVDEVDENILYMDSENEEQFPFDH